MRFFHDAEFLEDGNTIDLISYAIVAENGDELYLINRDCDWDGVVHHPWLRENVLLYLPGSFGPQDGSCLSWFPDETDPRVVSREELADRVCQFITSYGEDRDDHELWAWYGAYDHVALAQLFGPMIDLPRAIPMHTNDLKTKVGKHRVPDTLRARVMNEHDALADARWDRLVFEWAQHQEMAELLGWRQHVARRESEIAAYWLELSDREREDVRQATRGRGFTRALDVAAGKLLP